MKKKLLILLCLFFVCLAVFPLAKAEKLNSWNTIEEKDTHAIYELKVDEEVAGIIVHLETTSHKTSPEYDKIEVILSNRTKVFRIIPLENPYFEDINAIQDVIYLVNPADGPWMDYLKGVHLYKVRINLTGVKNPRLLKNRSYIEVLHDTYIYGDYSYAPKIKRGVAGVGIKVESKSYATPAESSAPNRPGFISYSYSNIGSCISAFTPARAESSVQKRHGIRFESVRDGPAEISTIIYYGGVGNTITFGLGYSEAEYGASLKVGFRDLNNDKWIRSPQTLMSIGKAPTTEGRATFVAQNLLDLATEVTGEVAEKAVPQAARVFGIATAVLGWATMVAEALNEVKVDDVTQGLQLLKYPGIHLEKGGKYEMTFDLDLHSYAYCPPEVSSAVTTATSYVDFCFDAEKKTPCFYHEQNEEEKKFWQRGVYIFETTIIYQPIPLKYKPLEARIFSPKDGSNWSSGQDVVFESRRKGGTGEFSYEWYDVSGEEPVLLSNKPTFKKQFPPGSYHIRLKVKDGYDYQVTDDAVFNVVPPKPKLDVRPTRRGIELEWNEYKDLGFERYEIYLKHAGSDHFFYLRSVRDRTDTLQDFLVSKHPALADHELCFKITLVTNSLRTDSNEACAKMPIRLSVVETNLTSITLSWTSVKSRNASLEYSTDKYFPFDKTKKVSIKAEPGKGRSNYTLGNLPTATRYFFRIKDENTYSNIVWARTKSNYPPKITPVRPRCEAIITPKYREPESLAVKFSSKKFSSAYGTNISIHMNASKGIGRICSLTISDSTGDIKKIEWDFGDGYKEMTSDFRHAFKPGKHPVKIRATDEFDAVTEESFVINLKSKPWASEIKVKGAELYGFSYGKLKISVDAIDSDGDLKAVNFYAVYPGKRFFPKEERFLGKDRVGTDGWSIVWDTSKVFDEEFMPACEKKEIDGKFIYYANFSIYAEVIDSDRLVTKTKPKNISIAAPLPDFTVSAEIERTKIDSNLLDELGIKIPKVTVSNLTAEMDNKTGEIRYVISGRIKNVGAGAYEPTGNEEYQFYLKREIPCPSWCFEGMPTLKVKTNASNVSKSKTGLVCNKSQVVCPPLAGVGGLGFRGEAGIQEIKCYCQAEISSGIIPRELKPGDFILVSASLPKDMLEKFSEETLIGRKAEVILAVDTNNTVLEESETNNVVSQTIWLESRVKPELIKGGDPHSLWYIFGKFGEWLDLTLTFNNKDKFEKRLKLASKRLEEAKRMLDSNDTKTSSKLLQEYTENMEKASELFERLPAEERLNQNKVLVLVSSAYVNTLKEMYRKDVPEFKVAIDRSLSIQEKAMRNVIEEEPFGAEIVSRFRSSGLGSDLDLIGVDMQRQVLVGKEIPINITALNKGNVDSQFRISLYEDGNLVKSTEPLTLCSGCQQSYTLKWKAREGISELSVGLEDPNDRRRENNYVSIGVEVLTPKCYTDQDCSDDNPCTKDLCVDSGTKKARCEHVPITECVNNDSCCPAGCNALNDNDCKSLCGNGICEPGEDQASCCKDCGCPEGYECKDNECTLKVYCGNGICDPNENRCTCPEDCGKCSGPCRDEPCWEWECVNNKCECEVQANCCGNYACEEGEYYLNCQTGEFNTQCPQDCCDPFIPHQADEPCQCPPNTEKTIINPETGEFVCECPPPQQTYNIQPNPPARGNQGYKSLPSQ